MTLQKRINGLKLNIKFTLLIILLVIFPIGVLGGVLYYNMENNVIQENVNYMQYTMERSRDNVLTNIDSINMATQLFLSDEPLLDVLNLSASGKAEMTTEELRDFYDTEIVSLERLVNNNQRLYGVHAYAVNDDVQEMMPILYNRSRMEYMDWAPHAGEKGWHYGYYDATFKRLEQEEPLVGLVTPIEDYDNGTIGVIEASMKMEDMFATLYEDIDNEWGFFLVDDGTILSGDKEVDGAEALAEEVLRSEADKSEVQTCYRKINGKKLVISHVYFKDLGGTLVSVQDITAGVGAVYRSRNLFVVIMSVLMVALAFFVNQIVKRMLRQFYEILKSIRKVQKGDLSVRIAGCGTDEMGELGTQINKMLDRIEKLMQDNLERELLAKNSEIKALQNQINAHFIYNVLESIKMMAEIDEEYAISDAITSLGKLLRYSMKWVAGNVQVKDELDYIKNYLALINLRFDYEIFLSLNLPDEILQQEIPKMSLQPIVENAIYHGIEQMAEDTNIYIKGIIEGTDCVIEITDAGKGMSEDEVTKLREKIAGKLESSGGSGHGIGLKNVQDRIRIAFGEGYGLEIRSRLSCYTKVSVRIPFQTGDPETKKEEAAS